MEQGSFVLGDQADKLALIHPFEGTERARAGAALLDLSLHEIIESKSTLTPFHHAKATIKAIA